jgi:hypothetical protein
MQRPVCLYFANRPLFVKHSQLLQAYTKQCIAAENFLHTSEENLTLLLIQDFLNVENELVLINATVNWARCEAQRRGLTGNDAGVRAVLEPRLLSLLRLLTLTTQQFVSGPAGNEQWLTVDEKWAITSCQNDKKITALPKHLSTSFALRKKCSLVERHREVIETRTNGVMLSGDGVNGVFRVTANCELRGFLLLSRCDKDPTVLSPNCHVYDEDLVIRINDYGTSLFTNSSETLLDSFQFQEKIRYNSRICIRLPKPVRLSPDSWYSIKIHFNEKAEYPSVILDDSGSSNGIEFKFYGENKRFSKMPKYDGLIRSLFLTPL